MALGNEVGSGVLVDTGDDLGCGVRRRSKDLVSQPSEDKIGGRSREAREGVGVLLGELVLLCVSDGVIGTLSSNSVPLREPCVSDRTQTRSPPILRARPLATSSPRPRPSFWRVRESSSRENGLNRYGKKAWGIPGPVSSTLMIMYRDFGLRAALSFILPSSVNLMAFRKTQEINFARSRSSTGRRQHVGYPEADSITYHIWCPAPEGRRTIRPACWILCHLNPEF